MEREKIIAYINDLRPIVEQFGGKLYAHEHRGSIHISSTITAGHAFVPKLVDELRPVREKYFSGTYNYISINIHLGKDNKVKVEVSDIVTPDIPQRNIDQATQICEEVNDEQKG